MSCQDYIEELATVLGKFSRHTNNDEDSMELSIAIINSVCKEDGKMNTFKDFLETMIHLKKYHFDNNREILNKMYKENDDKYN
jgi:hypothetical protein